MSYTAEMDNVKSFKIEYDKYYNFVSLHFEDNDSLVKLEVTMEQFAQLKLEINLLDIRQG